jgi:hypothetical protein
VAVRVGVAVGVGVAVFVGLLVLVGDGVDVRLAVAVTDAVALGTRVGKAVGLGVGTPSRATLDFNEWAFPSDKGPRSVDGFSPSCETIKKKNRTARNQKRAIARKVEIIGLTGTTLR